MKKILRKTQSLCDVCLKKVPARVFERDGRVYLEKKCDEHGKFTLDHTWDDPDIYRGLRAVKPLKAEAGQVAVAVTNKCNLNCPVCYAKANDVKIEDLALTDIDKVEQYPVIFLTGGEPTIYGDVFRMIKRLKNRGKKVVMFSNGLKLANYQYARKIKRAGLDCVILQFDADDDDSYEYIRGRNLVEIKKKAIRNLEKCNLPVYLYCTMIREKSFRRMENLFPFFDRSSVVKAISINPLWRLGRHDAKDFVPSSEILKKISAINNLKKNDWIESTRLLCNLDRLLSLVSARRRIFCKCNLKCMVLRYQGVNIPITKIFATRKINQKIERVSQSRSLIGFFAFLIYFFTNQILLNFFLNRNFRLFVRKAVSNVKYLFKKEYLLFSPLHFITISTFPALGSLDFDFIDNCNFNAVSSEDFNCDPACIHRIKALRRRENKENQPLN